MKKLILSALIICAGLNLKAQKEPIQQTNHHEIGVDASPFLAQILPGSYYTGSPYMITYRYHFKKSAIRAGIGYTLSTAETTTNDTLNESYKSSGLIFRAGYERKVDFGRHWQFFFGLDARITTSNSDRSYNYSLSQNYEQTEKNSTYGIAPLIGFRFKINERISVTTESSLLFYYYETDGSIKSTPDTYNNNKEYKSEGYRTNFTEPINIVFTYNF